MTCDGTAGVSAVAGRLDISYMIGSAMSVELTWRDEAGATVDVSGSATGYVLSSTGDSIEDGDLTIDTSEGAAGVMVVTLPQALSATLSTVCRYVVRSAAGFMLNGLLLGHRPGFGPEATEGSATVTVQSSSAEVTVTAAVVGGGAGAVESVNGQTGVVVLDVLPDPSALPDRTVPMVNADDGVWDYTRQAATVQDVITVETDYQAADTSLQGQINERAVGASSSTAGRPVVFADSSGKVLEQGPISGPFSFVVTDADGTIPDAKHPSTIARDTEVAAAITAHSAADDPHGDRAYTFDLLVEHVADIDPHGDRAYADGIVAAIPSGAAAGTPSLRALGTSGNTAAAGNDARLSDARTPTAHKTSHATGGSDALAPSDIGAVPTARTITAGTGLTGGGDLSTNRTLSADPEFIRDTIAAALAAGSGVTITVDDPGDTITIAATATDSAAAGILARRTFY